MTALVLAGNVPKLNATQYGAQSLGIMFCFGMATFVDPVAAAGTEDPSVFAPSGYNPTQWMTEAVAAGATYVVLVLEHVDGFKLYNSTVQPHNISLCAGLESRDFLREAYLAARAANLYVLIYFSVRDKKWDTAHPGASNATKLQACKDRLTEIQARCPNASGIWFDSWGWDVGYTAVDFTGLSMHFRSLWPHGVMVENNHEHDLSNTDVDVYEVEVDSIPGGSYPAPSERVDTMLSGTYAYFQTGAVGLRYNLAQVQSNLSANNNKGAAYLLNCPPGPDGVLASNITAILEAL